MLDYRDLPTITATINQYGLLPQKSLGQNFLTDLNITGKIACCAGDISTMPVIEVGPGPGALTRALLLRGTENLTCLEIDTRSINAIQDLIPYFPGRLTVMNCDALSVDWSHFMNSPYKIVANLPYNISTVLLFKWLECTHCIQQMTLMFQHEVAQRITASPNSKAYGRLSILTQYCFTTHLEFTLPPHVFFPPPQVHSSVVNFYTRHATFNPGIWHNLKIVTRYAFAQRRKMIKNQLKPLMDDVETWLIGLDIDPTSRAEALSLETFCRMAAHLPNTIDA